MQKTLNFFCIFVFVKSHDLNMKNTLSIKLKIFFLYLILFTTVILSGAYIYKEAKKFTVPETLMVQENNKVFLVSSTINNLYNSEAYSRNAILTGNNKDIQTYYQQLDTIVNQIDLIQKDIHDKVTISKLNTVKELIIKKKKSFNGLVQARKASNQANFSDALSEIYDIREEIEKNIQPIIIQSRDKQKRSAWARLFKGDNTDTIKTTVNYPSISDSLINAVQRIFEENQKKINEQQKNLFLQEQKLLEENKNITNQLRDILQNVEKNIIALSYQKINESKSHISTASTNIAYIGGSALLVIIILGWIIIRDINQNQEYRLALEKLNKEREVLLRSKTMLLATVTHDLQTPLGSLIGFTDLLDHSQLDNKQKQYITNIKSSSQYIRNLVNDLTDFSRLENNKISINVKTVNIAEIITNTCHLLLPNAENKKIKLQWEIDHALNTYFKTDPYRIKQILTNLISNAIKFTQNGGVFITATKVNNILTVQVKDTGIGIDKNDINNIFKEFKQAHEGIEKKFGGTGLGLNISKRLIKLLGGTITAESTLGEGSIFTITLPIIESDSTDEFTSSAEYQKQFEIFKENTILIVDDDKIQLQLMEEILSPTFKNVILINDSTEVLDILHNNKVDIILSDIQMPKLDGFELLSQIRSKEIYNNIPIIALSGKRDLSQEDFIKTGFTSSHPKPLELNELLIQMGQLLYPDQLFKKPKVDVSEVIDEEITTIKKYYNPETLKQFTGDDKESLNNILVIFLESTNENLLDINYAVEEFDLNTLGNIAHKMLPMFRQLEIYTVIPSLEKLEEHTVNFDSKQDLIEYIKELESKIRHILDLIKKEHLS